MSPHSPLLLSLLFLLLLSPAQTIALQSAKYKALFSLSRSLVTRVAAARDARGDLAGADRARHISDMLRLLGSGRDVWGLAWNYGLRGELPTAEIYQVGADLFEALGEVAALDSGAERASWMVRNCERVIGFTKSLFQRLLQISSKSGSVREVISALKMEVLAGELVNNWTEVVAEVSNLDSGRERAYWMIRNHERVTGLANSLFRSLLRVFTKSGTLREAILVIQQEVVEGELLKDCIEVGTKDLGTLVHMAKLLLSSVGYRDTEL